jgi:hypothetical protein
MRDLIMSESQKMTKRRINSAVRIDTDKHRKIKVFLVNNEDYDGSILTLNALHNYLYDLLLSEKDVQAILKRHIKNLSKAHEQSKLGVLAKKKQKSQSSDIEED